MKYSALPFLAFSHCSEHRYLLGVQEGTKGELGCSVGNTYLTILSKSDAIFTKTFLLTFNSSLDLTLRWIPEWSSVTVPVSFSVSCFLSFYRLTRASKTFPWKMQQDLPRRILTMASGIFLMPLPPATIPPGLFTSRSWHSVRRKLFHLIHLILPR